MEILKKVDKQGRLVFPKKWREKYLKDGIVLMKIEGEKIIIEPSKKIDLTKFFDSVEVDIQSDLSEWKKVKRELYEIS
jgi:bifunctional DNA-binding transcriptional regulator/antitoxin component of YhaV-PrlF toxin-antitoxin module